MSVFANIQRVLDERLKALAGVPFIFMARSQRPGLEMQLCFSMSGLRSSWLTPNYVRLEVIEETVLPGIYQIDIYGQLNRGVQTVWYCR